MCGLALNPSQGSGGYIKNAAGEVIAGHALSSFMLFYYQMGQWWEEDWRTILSILLSILMTISLLLLVYGLYLDAYCCPRCERCCPMDARQENERRRREGYLTIEEEEAGMIVLDPTSASATTAPNNTNGVRTLITMQPSSYQQASSSTSSV
jgi:hypothetical protein